MDPPSGASINYWLKNSDKDVKLIITNADNDTVKTINDRVMLELIGYGGIIGEKRLMI